MPVLAKMSMILKMSRNINALHEKLFFSPLKIKILIFLEVKVTI